MREGEAPSYFNPVEASVLVGLVAGLLQQHARRAAGVRPGDIGVIATYRKQVVSFDDARLSITVGRLC
jgi:hypothetical protein